MNFSIRILLLAALALARGGSLGRAAEPLQGYDKFQFFRTRNIFDPERKPPPRPVGTPAPASAPTVRRPNPVILTGTMATSEKTMAFFASNQPEYNKVLPLNKSIAGFKIVNISAGVVEVERNGQKTVLTVGDTLPIENALSVAEAGPNPADAPAPATGATTTPPASGAAASNPGAPAADADEIRRRMIERRQKEMSP